MGKLRWYILSDSFVLCLFTLITFLYELQSVLHHLTLQYALASKTAALTQIGALAVPAFPVCDVRARAERFFQDQIVLKGICFSTLIQSYIWV